MQFVQSTREPWHRAGCEDGPQPHPLPVAHRLLHKFHYDEAD